MDVDGRDPLRREVEGAVFASLDDLAVPPDSYRDRSVPLLTLMDGDEGSSIFIPDVDKALGVVTPRAEVVVRFQ